MIHVTYLACLVLGIAGLAIVDRRWKLAFWYDARRTAVTLGLSVAVFTTWDVIGIALGIFYRGPSVLTTGLTIFPEFPIEEIAFLTLLCYSALILYRGIGR